MSKFNKVWENYLNEELNRNRRKPTQLKPSWQKSTPEDGKRNAEEDFVGGDLKKFISGVEKIKAQTKYLNQQVSQLTKYYNEYSKYSLGQGGFRGVFAFDEDLVVKVALPNTLGKAIKMNIKESTLLKNAGDIYPKIYNSDPDGYWFIQEKITKVILTKSDFMSHFPKFHKLVTKIRSQYFHFATDIISSYDIIRSLFLALDNVGSFEKIKSNPELFNLFTSAEENRYSREKRDPDSYANKEDSWRDYRRSLEKTIPEDEYNLNQKKRDKEKKRQEDHLRDMQAIRDNNKKTFEPSGGDFKEAYKQQQLAALKKQKAEKEKNKNNTKARGNAPLQEARFTKEELEASQNFIRMYFADPDSVFEKIYISYRKLIKSGESVSFFDIRTHNVGENSSGELKLIDAGFELADYAKINSQQKFAQGPQSAPKVNSIPIPDDDNKPMELVREWKKYKKEILG
jgi:hypothetical protein